MLQKQRRDLEDYDFRPVPGDALESSPGATPATIIGRGAFIRAPLEADADVSGFDGGSDFGDTPEDTFEKFADVPGESYVRPSYAPQKGKRPVIAEFARPDSRYGVDPSGGDYGFPFTPVDEPTFPEAGALFGPPDLKSGEAEREIRAAGEVVKKLIVAGRARPQDAAVLLPLVRKQMAGCKVAPQGPTSVARPVRSRLRLRRP